MDLLTQLTQQLKQPARPVQPRDYRGQGKMAPGEPLNRWDKIAIRPGKVEDRRGDVNKTNELMQAYKTHKAQVNNFYQQPEGVHTFYDEGVSSHGKFGDMGFNIGYVPSDGGLFGNITKHGVPIDPMHKLKQLLGL